MFRKERSCGVCEEAKHGASDAGKQSEGRPRRASIAACSRLCTLWQLRISTISISDTERVDLTTLIAAVSPALASRTISLPDARPSMRPAVLASRSSNPTASISRPASRSSRPEQPRRGPPRAPSSKVKAARVFLPTRFPTPTSSSPPRRRSRSHVSSLGQGGDMEGGIRARGPRSFQPRRSPPVRAGSNVARDTSGFSVLRGALPRELQVDR